MAYNSYFSIIEAIKSAFLDTGLIRSVYFGPEDFFDNNRAVQFASVNISPQPSSLSGKVSTYNFTLEVVDRIDFSKDENRETFGQDNFPDILATLSKVIEIAFDKIHRGDNFTDLIRIDGDTVTAEPITYGGENYLGGWRVQISFQAPGGGVTDGRC